MLIAAVCFNNLTPLTSVLTASTPKEIVKVVASVPELPYSFVCVVGFNLLNVLHHLYHLFYVIRLQFLDLKLPVSFEKA